MPKKTNAICVQQAGSKRNRNDYSEDRNILAENIWVVIMDECQWAIKSTINECLKNNGKGL